MLDIHNMNGEQRQEVCWNVTYGEMLWMRVGEVAALLLVHAFPLHPLYYDGRNVRTIHIALQDMKLCALLSYSTGNVPTASCSFNPYANSNCLHLFICTSGFKSWLPLAV